MNREDAVRIVEDAKRMGEIPYLSMAYLSRAYLSGADLSGANLSGANLSRANLSWANLSGADLSGADLSGAELSLANLSWANLSGANLSLANLSRADLSGANLSRADLYGANLYGTNLSGVVGLLSQREWLREHCEVKGGLLVAYKAEAHMIADNWPKTWAWEPGAVLEEVVNPCRTNDCACGVNVGTREWCERNAHEGAPVWRVLVDPCGAVVPYNTDGKFRAEWVRLVEIVGGEG